MIRFFFRPEEYDRLLKLSTKAMGDLIVLYSMSDWSKKYIPTYYVDHGMTPVDTGKLGEVVFQDNYATV